MQHTRKPSGGFTLVELMIVVAIVGVLAAIAIPNFVKYIKKSKTAEAQELISRIYQGARLYFHEDHAQPGSIAGANLPKQFPETVAATPAASCCFSGGRCDPIQSIWETPSWGALHFSVNEPHYFRYAFQSQGSNNNANFTAYAYGDLDCDGELSTFTMAATGSNMLGGVSGTAIIGKENPLE